MHRRRACLLSRAPVLSRVISKAGMLRHSVYAYRSGPRNMMANSCSQKAAKVTVAVNESLHVTSVLCAADDGQAPAGRRDAQRAAQARAAGGRGGCVHERWRACLCGLPRWRGRAGGRCGACVARCAVLRAAAVASVPACGRPQPRCCASWRGCALQQRLRPPWRPAAAA